MAFIGNVPAESYITTVKDTFSGNGSTTAFTLSQPTLTNDVRVVVENVVQEPTTAYSVAGTTLTFTSAPPSGSNNVYVIHLGPAVQTTVPPETFGVGSIYGASDTDTAITFEGSGVTTFDQNGSEAARFDASGNFLVGKTASNLSAAGVQAQADGALFATRTGDSVVWFNKLSANGNIVRFQKDGTQVGAIGTYDTDIHIGSGDVGLSFYDAGDTVLPFNPSTPVYRDNAIDLGNASNRFKNLYLSGGVYVGGTGAANYLDDYEEGTWTPTLEGATSGSATYSANNGAYVKIGRFVHCIGMMNVASTSAISGTCVIKGLPFAMADVLADTGNDAIGTMANINFLSTSVGTVIAQGNQNLNGFELRYWAAGGGTGTTNLDGSDLSSTGSCRFDLRYYTTA